MIKNFYILSADHVDWTHWLWTDHYLL